MEFFATKAPWDVAAGGKLSALAVLHHRGPDATRVRESAAKTVTLGHPRLSSIDLDTGDQPLANEDGSLQAVVNGEFYDFEAIRGQLESRGHRFRTRSDSEILLHLYEEHGLECAGVPAHADADSMSACGKISTCRIAGIRSRVVTDIGSRNHSFP